jgi:tetratricopeptide (TPR) repeat protein
VLGVALYGQRRFDQAIEAFLRVIELDPAIPQPYLFLSGLLDQAGPSIDRIIAADQAWVAREPQNGQAKLTLAKALMAKDRKSERARDLLQQAIASNQTAWEPHYQLGLWFENSRDYPAAAAELKRATELDPKQPLPHYHLARVYDRLGQTDDARRERELHQSLMH